MKCDRCNKEVRKLFMATNGEYVCASCIKEDRMPDNMKETLQPEEQE